VTTYDTVKHGGLSNELRLMCFRCVVLDEGHRIRNEDAGIDTASMVMLMMMMMMMMVMLLMMMMMMMMMMMVVMMMMMVVMMMTMMMASPHQAYLTLPYPSIHVQR